MAFKMKGFSGFKQTSPVGELLGMFEEYTEKGEGPRGTVQEGGKKRDMTPGEIASQRYITKTVRDKIPEKHRADFNYQLSKGRLDGDTLEDQAQALHKTMSSPAKQTDEEKTESWNRRNAKKVGTTATYDRKTDTYRADKTERQIKDEHKAKFVANVKKNSPGMTDKEIDEAYKNRRRS